MKRILLLFLGMSLLFISCDHIQRLASGFISKEINEQLNEEGQKNKDLKNGLVESHHSNGKLRTAINYKDGKKHGEARLYYKTGKLKMLVTYENGIRQGPAEYYYQDGSIFRKSNYKNGELEGIRQVFRSGNLQAEVPYHNGHPGKGLKEYFVGGKVKTGYPELEVELIDERQDKGLIRIEVYFSEPGKKDEFYIGELKDGKYLHDDIEELPMEKGKGVFIFEMPPNATINNQLDVIGVHKTSMNNPYVTGLRYDVILNKAE